MPTRLCSDPGCASVAVYRGRCRGHARRREQEIRRPGRALYRTKRWRITRERVLADQPLCECGQLAEHVHHRVDLSDGGDPWARANLQGLCASCHGRLTRRAQM